MQPELSPAVSQAVLAESDRRIDSVGISLSNVNGTEDLSPQTYNYGEKTNWLNLFIFQYLYQKGFASLPYNLTISSICNHHQYSNDPIINVSMTFDTFSY